MNELELFAAVIAIAEPGERAAVLERECAGRPDPRNRIDQLVRRTSSPMPWSIPKSGGAAKRIRDALDALIELYTATNKPEEVKKWHAERAKHPEAKPTEKK